MADTSSITSPSSLAFSGLGSGIDTRSMVTALVNASYGQIQALQNWQAQSEAAVTSLSTTASLLSTLTTAASALLSTVDIGSFTALSDNTVIVPSALSTALPGSYQLTVSSLAKEQRSYSQQFDARAEALGMIGALTL